MLSCATRTFMRRAAVMRPMNVARFTTVDEAATVSDALKFSGYSEIDFTIPEDAKVYDAVQKFAAYNIGCLVVTDKAGTCVYRDRCQKKGICGGWNSVVNVLFVLFTVTVKKNPSLD